MGILPMLVMEHSVISTFRQTTLRHRATDIRGQLNQIAGKIGAGNSYIDTKTPIFEEDITMLSGIYGGRILLVNSQMNIIYDSYVFEEGKTIISDAVINGLMGVYEEPNYLSGDGLMEIMVPIHDSGAKIIGLLMMKVGENEFIQTAGS